MNTQHTPTPWAVWQDNGSKTLVRIDNELTPRRAPIAECALSHGIGAAGDEDKANAAFIVRACNSHDELVAALRAILREANHSNDPDFDDIKDIAEAALAKAGAV